jgi:hypothetical protein
LPGSTVKHKSSSRTWSGRTISVTLIGVAALVSVLAARQWLLPQVGPGVAEGAAGGQPIGRHVVTGHVEGQPGDYLPNREDPRLNYVRLFDTAGRSRYNAHATSTAVVAYGRSGLAPGVRDVYCFPVDHFLQAGCLRAGTDQPPFVPHDIRVFNHSWIGGEPPLGKQIIRRVDYLIDTDNVIMCVGVNNGRNTPIPVMLASAYNAIAVGAASGNSSGGYTTFEGSGRCKPDIVASRNLTSYTTAVITASVAKLLEVADNMGEQTERARRNLTIKAVLMAGAVKPRRWSPSPGKPLDEHLGAGVVDFDKSMSILVAGLNAPPLLRQAYGWDLRHLKAGDQHAESYRIVLDKPLAEWSIMLVWHRRIDGRTIEDPITGSSIWIDRPSLANFDLRLYRSDDAGRDQLVAESVSTLDNIEHVYVQDLPPGRYRIDVRRADTIPGPWEYALAWRMEDQPAAEPEATDADPPAPDAVP